MQAGENESRNKKGNEREEKSEEMLNEGDA